MRIFFSSSEGLMVRLNVGELGGRSYCSRFRIGMRVSFFRSCGREVEVAFAREWYCGA